MKGVLEKDTLHRNTLCEEEEIPNLNNSAFPLEHETNTSQIFQINLLTCICNTYANIPNPCSEEASRAVRSYTR